MQVLMDIARGFLAYVLLGVAAFTIFYFVLPGFGTSPLTPAMKARAFTAVAGGGALLLLLVIVFLAIASSQMSRAN